MVIQKGGFMEKLNIYELLYQMRMDDEYAGILLEEEFKPLLISCVNERLSSNLRGSRLFFDDLYQEALMGLLEAVETYREDKSAAFTTYSKIIIENKLKNYTRELLRKTDVPLELQISLDEMYSVNGEQYTLNVKSNDLMRNPEYRLQVIESRNNIEKAIMSMNVAEREVLFVWHEGYQYAEAANKLNISTKTYDGRLYRVRKKLKEFCLEDEEYDKKKYLS